MRNPDRIPRITKKFGQLWRKHPDWRFNQLLINAGVTPDGAYWHMPDDAVEEVLDQRLAEGF